MSVYVREGEREGEVRGRVRELSPYQDHALEVSKL